MSRPPSINNSKPEFRLRLLGSSSLTDRAGTLVPGMGPGKPLAMLAYLVFHPSVRRDELVALLWGDVVEGKARNAFRQTLHRLRSALGEDILPSGQDQIVLQAGDQLWCDATSFRESISAGEIEQAIALYGGEFLEGLELKEYDFTDWVEDRRRKFKAAYEGALSRSAEGALDGGNWQLAVRRAQELSRLAPLDSQAAVLEATALVAGGRRAEAITTLTVHSKRIQSELGSKVPPAVSSMLQSLLTSGPRGQDKDAQRLEGNGHRFRQPEFVGRETELARLLAAWRRACAGEGSGILIVGDVGAGKSRFVSEFLQRSPSIAAPLTLSGQERPATVRVPYASIAEALRPALNAPGLSGASRHLLAEAARLLPELRDQFDLPQPAGLGDDTERVRFFEGIAALIDAVAYEQPVCMILEDLDHAPACTVELVQYLGRRLRKSPVLIIATWSVEGRPESRASTSIALAGSNSAHTAEGFDRIDIQPLSLDESERLIDAVLGPAGVSPDDRRRLAGLSAGTPLRVLELAERARDGDVAPAFPVTVRDVLWRRLKQCSPHEQRLFVAAALFTQAVTIRLLAAAAHMSESAALEGVQNLERSGLLIDRDGRMTPANTAAADLALQSTGAAGVALLAGWAADALVAERASAAGELARLYSLAEQKPAAYRFARVAAMDAAACGAYDDAERFLSLATASATTEAERADVAALARSIGGGPRLLLGATGAAVIDQDEQVERVEPSDTTGDRPREAGMPGLRLRKKMLTIRWSSLRVRSWLWIAGAVTMTAAAIIGSGTLDGRAGTRGSVLADTLVLVERLDSSDVRYFLATGPLSSDVRRVPATWTPFNRPRWVDSLSLPWMNPVVSPDGRAVAVERISPQGIDLYIIDAATRRATPLAVGEGDHLAQGWSPDGSRLLVISGSTSADGVYGAGLFAYAVSPAGARVALDIGAARTVTEARWSPRGTDVAWVARDADRQQDVFTAGANGGRVRNLSRHPAEDYDLAWSADGERVAFTSERDGNAEIYSAVIATGQLSRMTFHPTQDRRPVFSPDGQFLAFESVRSDRLETYVMAALAGSPRPLTGAGARLEIVGWKGRSSPFVDAIRIRANAALEPGDSTLATAETTDQYGNEMAVAGIRWSSLNPNVVGVRPAADTALGQAVLVAGRPGFTRVVADLGDGWRADTLLIQVGPAGAEALTDGFETPGLGAFWIPLGTPRPYAAAGAGRDGTGGLVPNGDSRWESGVLGSTQLQLRAGLTVQVWVRAPFAAARPAARGFTISLVAPGRRTPSLDSIAPQMLRLVEISWLGDGARMSYSAEGERLTEPVILIGDSDKHVFRISIEPSGQATFYVDDKLRWRSTVSLLRAGESRRAQLWLGSQGTGNRVVMDDVQITPGESARTPGTRR